MSKWTSSCCLLISEPPASAKMSHPNGFIKEGDNVKITCSASPPPLRYGLRRSKVSQIDKSKVCLYSFCVDLILLIRTSYFGWKAWTESSFYQTSPETTAICTSVHLNGHLSKISKVSIPQWNWQSIVSVENTYHSLLN